MKQSHSSLIQGLGTYGLLFCLMAINYILSQMGHPETSSADTPVLSYIGVSTGFIGSIMTFGGLFMTGFSKITEKLLGTDAETAIETGKRLTSEFSAAAPAFDHVSAKEILEAGVTSVSNSGSSLGLAISGVGLLLIAVEMRSHFKDAAMEKKELERRASGIGKITRSNDSPSLTQR